MTEDKKEGKNYPEKNDDNSEPTEKESVLDGKKLHDLYRHTTKLIE